MGVGHVPMSCFSAHEVNKNWVSRRIMHPQQTSSMLVLFRSFTGTFVVATLGNFLELILHLPAMQLKMMVTYK